MLVVRKTSFNKLLNILDRERLSEKNNSLQQKLSSLEQRNDTLNKCIVSGVYHLTCSAFGTKYIGLKIGIF
jgi:hypothetical protein